MVVRCSFIDWVLDRSCFWRVGIILVVGGGGGKLGVEDR